MTKETKQENKKEEAPKTIETATVQELQSEAFVIGEQIKELQRRYNIVYDAIKNKISKN